MINLNIHNLYRKLQQYPFSMFGYWFWKNEKHFSVIDHVKTLDYKYLVGDTKYDTTALEKLHTKILHNTFPTNKSPWEITLIIDVPKINQDKSLVALRLNHCLGDGKSVIELVVEGLGGSVAQSASSSKSNTKNNKFSICFNFTKAALKLYPNIIDLMLKYL